MPKRHPKPIQETLAVGQKFVSKGPIFDNKYLHHYSKRDYLIVGLILAMTIGITTYFLVSRSSRPTAWTESKSEVISQTIQSKDNQTKLARRAIAEYLKSNTELTLSDAQKLFIETSIAQAHKGTRLQVGATVEFQISEIESLIEKSNNLTATQIKAWSDRARYIRF